MIQATEKELNELISFYQVVTDNMEENALTQWHWGKYPNEEVIRKDVEAGRMYYLREGDEISFRGEWRDNERGGAMHWTHRAGAGRRPARARHRQHHQRDQAGRQRDPSFSHVRFLLPGPLSVYYSRCVSPPQCLKTCPGLARKDEKAL